MNRHQAVVLSNRLCIEVAQKVVDRRRWPVGGWGGLPAGEPGDAMLRRRVEALVASPHVGDADRRALLALYEAPPAEPTVAAPDEAPVVEEAEAAAEPTVAAPDEAPVVEEAEAAAEPTVAAPDEAPVVEEAEAAAEPTVAEPEVAVDDPPEAASRRGGSRLPRR